MKDYVLSIYADRFNKNVEKRNAMWKILCKDYFQQFVGRKDTVLDLAAGYCEFINNIQCGQKIAVDLNVTTKKMAAKDVKVYTALSTEMPKKLTDSVDVVFVSNFFEHLDNKDELIQTLREIARVLKPTGKLIILQPNIRLVGNAYWDFVDHSLALTEKSLAEALHLTDFTITFQKTRFLPYSMSSRIPMIPALVRAYLKFPLAQFFMGKQTLVVARKSKSKS